MDRSRIRKSNTRKEIPSTNIMFRVRYSKWKDLPDLLRIYNEAVRNSPATFDLRPQTPRQRENWYESHGGLHPIIVAVSNSRVIGYASLSKFREKLGYSRTVESSVYVDRDFRGAGVGSALMQRLVERAKQLRYHTIVAAVVPPNAASARLHESLGFERVGTLREVGFKFRSWQDVSWYQLIL